MKVKEKKMVESAIFILSVMQSDLDVEWTETCSEHLALFIHPSSISSSKRSIQVGKK
jgi:hypothetical protein